MTHASSRPVDTDLQTMQQALEEGLKAIAEARTIGEAEAARDRARARLEALAWRRATVDDAHPAGR
ncbi:MAG TPA: hypothetical protein PLQ13_08365 [Candidatus Krumholzibacteria bacterium]|nr:hypothetical protein [Candidatus Krumholzibacteria bacterium]